MGEDNNEGRRMTRRDARDGEGGDLFAGVTGTFVVHLFDCDGDKRGDTASGGQRRGDGERRQQQDVAVAGNNGLGQRRFDPCKQP